MTALSLKKDSPKKDAEAVVDVMIVHNTKNTLLSLAPAGTLHEARVGISQQTKGTALYQDLPLLRFTVLRGRHEFAATPLQEHTFTLSTCLTKNTEDEEDFLPELKVQRDTSEQPIDLSEPMTTPAGQPSSE